MWEGQYANERIGNVVKTISRKADPNFYILKKKNSNKISEVMRISYVNFNQTNPPFRENKRKLEVMGSNLRSGHHFSFSIHLDQSMDKHF